MIIESIDNDTSSSSFLSSPYASLDSLHSFIRPRTRAEIERDFPVIPTDPRLLVRDVGADWKPDVSKYPTVSQPSVHEDASSIRSSDRHSFHSIVWSPYTLAEPEQVREAGAEGKTGRSKDTIVSPPGEAFEDILSTFLQMTDPDGDY